VKDFAIKECVVMKRNKIVSFLLMFVMLIGQTTGASATEMELKAKKKITLNKKKVKLKVGQRIKLKANKKVKWISKNKKIATVSAKGVVKAKKVGRVKIVAKKGKLKAVCLVNVVKKSSDGRAFYKQLEADCPLALVDIEDAKIGKTIRFGEYEQDGYKKNGKEPIRWRVLDKKDDKLFVQSEVILDMQPYNDKQTKVTWETCSVRSWLNDEFFTQAFNEDEQKRIFTTRNVNTGYSGYISYADGGNSTEDKVFLLSWEELNKYYEEDEYPDDGQIKSPVTYASYFARQKGATEYDEDHSGSSSWILRNSSIYNEGVMFITWYYFADDGKAVSSKDGIRPAMWITNGTENVSQTIYEPVAVEPEKEVQNVPAIENQIIPFEQVTKENVKEGDVITFGEYWQSDNNNDGIADKNDAKEPIQWRVISIDKDKGQLYVMSEKGLDCQPFHNEKRKISWESCSLREWLNNEFVNSAFSVDEQKKILITDNAAVQDKVFLLSYDEVVFKYKFAGPENKDLYRRCQATEYCKAQGAWVGINEGRKGNCFWWLRTMASFDNKAELVSPFGEIVLAFWGEGDIINEKDNAVRPAMRLSLKG